MAVVKGKRKESQFEVLKNCDRVRSQLTDLAKRQFGYSEKKAERWLARGVGGKAYEELDYGQKKHYEANREKLLGTTQWFIPEQRKTLIQLIKLAGMHLEIANRIRPICMEELNERRLNQGKSIGYLKAILNELRYTMYELPVDVNSFAEVTRSIGFQVALIGAWRESDNKIRRALSKPPPTSPM